MEKARSPTHALLPYLLYETKPKSLRRNLQTSCFSIKLKTIAGGGRELAKNQTKPETPFSGGGTGLHRRPKSFKITHCWKKGRTPKAHTQDSNTASVEDEAETRQQRRILPSPSLLTTIMANTEWQVTPFTA